MQKQFVIALTVLFAFAFGCGKSEKTYKTADGKVKVKMATGDKGVALPDNFPKDVPILKGATVKIAMTQGKQMVVHLLVSGSVADAAKYYTDELKGQGWEIETTMNMGESSMLSAKKDKRQCTVVAAKESDGTLVQLSVSQEGS